MTDSNRVRLGFVLEGVDGANFGVTPANPAFQTLRVTAIDLAGKPNTKISEEIRDDRQISDQILVGQSTDGGFEAELSFGAFDGLLEAVMFGSWAEKSARINLSAGGALTSVTAATGTVALVSGAAVAAGHLVRLSGFGQSANNGLFRAGAGSSATALVSTGAGLVNEAAPPVGAALKVVGFQGAAGDLKAAVGPNRLTSAVLDFTTLGLSVGEWVKIGGGAAVNRISVAGCNGWARIGAIAANALTLDIAPAGFAVANETTSIVQVWIGDLLRNGVTRRSFTAEESFLGQATPTHLYHRGLTPASVKIDVAANDVVKTEFRFIGRSSTDQDQRLTGASSLAATTAEVLNSASNVGRLAEGGAPVSGPNFVTGFSLSIDNNLRPLAAVGSLGAVRAGVGRSAVTGRLSTYFGSRALLAKLLSNQASSYDLILTDSLGRSLLIDLPMLKFSSGAPQVSAADRDVMLDLDFQAIRHPGLGCQIQMQRFTEGT
jgi:hypothetical protein